MPIKEADKSYDHKKIEKKIQNFWIEGDTFSKVNKLRANGPQYSFLDGPPYCSGKIHLGTAWNKVIKDSYLRYKSMNGFSLRRQAGWDMHGLPIEHKVEELMGIKSKQEIEENIGIAKFVDKCKEFAIDNKLAMEKEFDDLGVWMDWEDPYMTLDPKYMESSWWTLKRANEQNLLVNDKRVISWCPHCETALAAAEIDYEEKVDPSIFVKFPVKTPILEDNGLPEFFLVWTTTPWTLPANLAICVNPEFDYALVKIDGEILLLAQNLVETVLGPATIVHKTKIPAENEDEEDKIIKETEVVYEIVKVVKGESLLHKSYIYPLEKEVSIHDEFDKNENVHTILPGDHVELGEGTGFVHTAPGHGPDDFEVGKAYDLPIFCPVDESGNFTDDAGKYAGEFCKAANDGIIADLQESGLMYRNETIEHRYGVCWRCKTPIIYLATKQWFLKVTDIKQKMLDEIDKVEWVPQWAGQGRFRDWVDNAKDWTISRQRYWGIPIPIWECPDCGELKVIGSVEELKNEALNDISTINAYQIRRGNPELKNTTVYTNTLMLNHKCTNNFTYTLSANDVYTVHPQLATTFRENGKFITQEQNGRYYHQLHFTGNINWSFFDRQLRLFSRLNYKFAREKGKSFSNFYDTYYGELGGEWTFLKKFAVTLAFGKRADVFSDEKIYYNSWEVASGIMYVWKNWNFSGLMKWRLGNSYAFWEKSMNPYVVSDMRHYVSDTKNQIMLRVAWKFKFGHQRKSASQRIENSGGESAVF